MAINTQKLLPSAKSSSLAKIGAIKIVPAISIKKKSIDTQKLLGPKKDEPGQIVKILTDIDVRLKLLLKEEQTQQGKKRKEKEKADFEKQEKKLESPKEAKKINLPTLSLPGASFLDRIKRFIFFTALGWLFTKFQDQLPKLEGILKTVIQVYGVAENIFKFLLGSFVNFIDRGYQAYDKVRDLAKSIGGEKAQQEFDNLSGKLNEYINYALIGGMALTGAINAFSNEVKGRKGKDGGRTGGYSSGYAAGYAAGLASGKGIRPGAGFRDPGRYRAPGQARAGGDFASQQTRSALTRQNMLRPEGPRGPLDRVRRGFRGAAAQLETGTLFKRGAGAQRALYNLPGKAKNLVPAKQLLKVVKGPLSRLPILGGLIEFGLSWALGDPIGKAAFRGVGTLLLGAVGSLILPGFGTFIGGWAGAELAGKLYEVLFENKQPQGKVQKKQGGGPVTRGGKTQSGPSRSIKITRRRPPKVKPKQSQPGKDVGGKKKIRELYPDPSVRTDIEGEQKGAWWNLLPPLQKDATPDQIQQRNDKIKALPNSYKALTGVAKILKNIPFGIGALMGGAVDIALGQKLPNDAINNLSNGVSYLINAVANRQVSASISNIEKEITKMQTGGAVPRIRDIANRDEFGLGKDISKALDGMIRQKVDEAIREVQKQLMPIKYGEKKEKMEGEDLDMTPGNIKVTSGSSDFWLLVTAALFENGISTDGYQGAADAAQAIYNRVSLPGWPKSVRGVILQPGQFQPVSDYGGIGEWEKINSKESAIAFAKKYKGYSGNIVEKIAATLLDKTKQENARTFVGPRDNFRSDAYEKANDHLDDSTEKSRYGHTFGFEPRGANIGRFKKGQLMPAEVNKEVVAGKVEEMEMGAGYGSAGSKIAGELGRFMKKKGVVPGSIHRHPEHPPYSLTSGHSPGSLHYQGRAIDLGANADEQGPILKAIAEFNKIKGVKPVELLHAGNEPSGHSDHVHVAYQGGGLIPKQSPKNRSSSLSMYPSYSAEGGMMIAIQPMIIEKTIPVPSGRRGGGGAVVFPIAGVNNSSMQSLSRG